MIEVDIKFDSVTFVAEFDTWSDEEGARLEMR